MPRTFDFEWIGTKLGEAYFGSAGDEKIKGRGGNDVLVGGGGNDRIAGNRGDDTIEAGQGNDVVRGGKGHDLIYSFSWGGEPEIAQDPDAEKVEPDEPLDDNDRFILGEGADTLVFRWLIDATDEILDKHRDETGDVDYRAVAQENGSAHAHWVEHIGHEVVRDYSPEEDMLVFEGHTVALDRIVVIDADKDGQLDDSIAYFYSEQGGAGAHQGDELGTVTFIDYIASVDDIRINTDVFYGVEDPYTAAG